MWMIRGETSSGAGGCDTPSEKVVGKEDETLDGG